LFEFALLEYNRAFNLFDDLAWSAVAVFMALLAEFPDSHIERKYGNRHTKWVNLKVTAVNCALSTSQKPEQLLPMLYELDKAFKDKGINPGTSADLTVATVLLAYLEGL
jgi:triphosphoribosyl-dephospho-CoA synthase